MYRMFFCVAQQNFTQESANSPHSFCPFIRVNMAKEELTRCVVDHDSGMCKACSAGDEAPFVVNVSGKADFASDDAPVAVLSSLSTLKSPSTRKGRKWVSSAFEELVIDPIMYGRVLSEFPPLSREAFKASLRCVFRELTERVIIVRELLCTQQTPPTHAPS